MGELQSTGERVKERNKSSLKMQHSRIHYLVAEIQVAKFHKCMIIEQDINEVVIQELEKLKRVQVHNNS